jgi:SNF2 family DNA or RNA helicase
VTFVTRDAEHVLVPWRQDLATLIPHAKKLPFEGAEYLVIPNRQIEAKLCRNLGVPVPAPMLTRYHWTPTDGREPWETQKTTAALLSECPRAYVLSTMGTGKTRSALFAADFLLDQGIGPWLIAAPLSTLSLVWEQELFSTLTHRTWRVLHGPRQKRLDLLNETADFYIINHHGLDIIQDELIKKKFQGVIIDELATFRTKGTALWKACNAVINAPSTQFAWGMTGSPTPNAPTDAWAQIRMLTPGRTTRSMQQFRDTTMRKLTTFKWAPLPNANELVHQAMQPSVRYTRDDVMELPENVFVDRVVKLEPDTAKAYKMLVEKMHHMTQSGESITAVNEGVLHNKLLQVSCGYIYTDNKSTVYALPSDSRLEAMEQLVSENDRKTIVFVSFIHALEGIAEYLKKKGHAVATVSGSTPRGKRDKIFSDFMNKDDPRVIVAHPQCMAHGLTLTEANMIIWYSPTQSLEIYEQANARITRPGQTSKTMIVHLAGTPVEKSTYKRLRDRGNMQGMLLQLFKDQEIEL